MVCCSTPRLLVIEESREIAIAQPLVDQRAQPMLGYAEPLREQTDREARLAVDAARHHRVEFLFQNMFGRAEPRRARGHGLARIELLSTH